MSEGFVAGQHILCDVTQVTNSPGKLETLSCACESFFISVLPSSIGPSYRNTKNTKSTGRNMHVNVWGCPGRWKAEIKFSIWGTGVLRLRFEIVPTFMLTSGNFYYHLTSKKFSISSFKATMMSHQMNYVLFQYEHYWNLYLQSLSSTGFKCTVRVPCPGQEVTGFSMRWRKNPFRS